VKHVPIPDVGFAGRTRGLRVATNASFNLAGQMVPAIAAFFAVPVLLRLLGNERFALLAVAWTIVGYFSIFDFGFGRALTRELACRRTSEEQWLGSLVWTALTILGAVGITLAVVLALLTPLLVRQVLHVPLWLQPEARSVFLLLAIALPAVTLSNALRGILEAEHAFRLLSMIRIPTALGMVLGPMLVAYVTTNLFWVVASIIFFRLLSFGWHLMSAIQRFPLLRQPHPVARECASVLVATGGWITVSSVVSPLMVSADRFFIGSFLSLTAVAYYSTAYEVATKLWLISGALAGVLFPAFAEALAKEPAQATRLLAQSLKALFVVLFPIAAVIVLFAPELLRVWIGNEVAEQSARLLAWMTCAVLFNCLGQLYFAYLQAGGRAAWTAAFHLLELPLYYLMFTLLVPAMGLFGAALAWTIRMSADTLLLAVASWRMHPRNFPSRDFVLASAMIIALVGSSHLGSFTLRMEAFVALNLFVFLYFYLFHRVALASIIMRLRNCGAPE
jgi:O-antigen/teichoic acid export membrane protein